MARRGPKGLSFSQKSELWDRWKKGQSLAEIGEALSRCSSSIYRVVSPEGGIAPALRRRSCLALSLAEREEVSRGIAAGCSSRKIAAVLGRAPSTISREILRNGGRERYRANEADQNAWDRSRRPKRCRLSTRARLRQVVAKKLQLEWSPQQIAGWLKREWAGNDEMQVSHETIYRSLFIQARGVLKQELTVHLRSKRTMRHSRHWSRRGGARGQIPGAISIRERPAEVADRAVPGHWEGDLIAGTNHTYISTLVERKSRFTILVKVESKETAKVVKALIKQIRKLPRELRKSLTWDRGMEMANHREFSVATDVDVFFCDPQSPWQRGSNENTNRLLRQYYPKGTDLSVHSQADLNRIARRLNQRPRETLGFRTPAQVLFDHVALTG